MEAWLERKFERHGRRYLIAGVGCLLAVVVILLVPGTAILAARYEGLTLSQYGVLVGIIEGLAIAVLVLALVLRWHRVRPAFHWLDHRDGAFEAHARQFAFDGPRQLSIGALAIGSPASVLLAAALLTPVHHTTALDWTFVLVSCELSVVLAVLYLWFTLDILLQPMRAALGGPSGTARPTSLVARLTLVIPTAVAITAVSVGLATTTRAHAGPGHGLVVYGIGGACLILCMMFIGPLFTGGVIAPFGRLARATREIAAGRYQTRLPVVATDELGRLAQSFNQMLDELQASRERIVTASDEARRRVERDLHDGAQQRLVLLKLQVSAMQRRPGADPMLSEIAAGLDTALAELRDLARGLYPPLLESDGLAGALPDAAGRAPIPATVDADGIGRYRPELEAAVYFCCLEALQNAAKHAGPGATAQIGIRADDRALEFTVTDNGAGFDSARVNGSSGLQNMADRIGALGGELRIESSPGLGTTVSGRVPVR